MAGNSPHLPPDTVSRSIRVLLMPDLDGTVEDSDWEMIEDNAKALHQSVADFADAVRDQVRGMVVDLPHGCIGRSKEKWRPLKRVARAAGGRWPAIADRLIVKSMAEDAAEREAGLRTLPIDQRTLRQILGLVLCRRPVPAELPHHRHRIHRCLPRIELPRNQQLHLRPDSRDRIDRDHRDRQLPALGTGNAVLHRRQRHGHPPAAALPPRLPAGRRTRRRPRHHRRRRVGRGAADHRHRGHHGRPVAAVLPTVQRHR